MAAAAPAASATACTAPPAGRFTVVPQQGIFGGGETQVSKDGRIAAAVAASSVIQIWNVTGTGSRIAIVELQDTIARFALRPDGRALALASEGRVWLKDLASGALLPLALPAGDVGALVWTADGSRLFVARGQQTDIVDGASGALQSSLAVGAAVGGVSPDGRWVLSREGGLWDVRERRELWKVGAPIQHATFSESGLVLAYATNERPVMVVDAATGKRRWQATIEARDGELALSPDGQSLAFVDDGLSLWRNGRKVRLPRAGASRQARPAFSPDSTKVAFVGESNELRVVSTTGALAIGRGRGTKSSFDLGGVSRTEAPHWSDDGRLFYPGVDGLVVVDPAKGARKLVGNAAAAGPPSVAVHDAVWSPDDDALLVLHDLGEGDGRSAASVVDLANGNLRPSFDARVRFMSAEWSASGLVALERHDGFVVWNPKSNEPARFADHPSSEGSHRLLALSAQGTLLATVPDDSHEVRIWDTRSAKRKATLTVDDGRIEAVAFSADGTRLAVAADFASSSARRADLLVYDTASSELVSTLHSPPHRPYFGAATSLHWSPRGRAVVSVDQGQAVRLWSLGSEEPPVELVSPPVVGPAALANDGNILVMGQNLVDVWDLRARTHAPLPSGDGTPVQKVRVNHAGTIVAITRQDHVDVIRLADGAHLTVRLTDPSASDRGVLLHDDEGRFAGSKVAASELRVRDRSAPLEVRPLGADEAARLQRAALGRDFVAGCAAHFTTIGPPGPATPQPLAGHGS